MNQLNLRRLATVHTTVTYCESPESSTATAGITNFAPRVAAIKAKQILVQSYNRIGDATTRGVRLNVEAIRASMVQHVDLLSNALRSFAASLTTPDYNLMVTAKVNPGKLMNISVEDCATECQRVCKLAADNAANIQSFGANAAHITDTAALINLFMKGISDPRTAVITRNNAKQQADLLLRNIMEVQLALQLDTMANTLRFTNAEWWAGYRAAREIINPGTFTTVLKIQVFNQANDKALKNVKCFRDSSDTFKKCSKLGYITYRDIEEGNHSFVLKHKRFQDLTLTDVMIAHGKRSTIKAEMKPVLR